jgi:uroporphyrinogen-III decarboxylase
MTLTLTSAMRDRIARLKAGVAGCADCIPITAQLRHHAATLAGVSAREFYTNAETFLATQFAAWERYELDDLSTHFDLYNIEAEALGAPMTWCDDAAPEADPARRLLTSIDDWTTLRAPVIGRAGRMPYALEINDRLMELGLPAKVRFCGPVTIAAKLMGLDELLIACMTTPEKVHALFTFLCDEVIAPWIACQRERANGDETAGGADAFASPPMMTISMLHEFLVPYVDRFERAVGKVRLAALWGESTLADPRPLQDIKRHVYPGMLQALDPDASALGPDVFVRYAREHDMAMAMGIDAGLIEHGPVSAIRERATQFCQAGASEGRFVLFLNDIPANTPREHVHAAVEVAHAWRF